MTDGLTRRDFLTTSATTAATLASLAALPGGPIQTPADTLAAPTNPPATLAAAVTLPPLPYAVDALEPHIDATTMTLHHQRHHAAYVAGLNKALADFARVRAGGDPTTVPAIERALAFHGGGHVNHTLFWANMAPCGRGGGGEPFGPLADQIKTDFGGLRPMLAQFTAAALAVEGSGWVWLVWQPLVGKLLIETLLNQQDLHLPAAVPLLGCDVWEHAYYLTYQNRRADYLRAWWNVVHWGVASQRFDNAH